MNLTLVIDGKEKKFGKPRVTGATYREFLDMNQRIDFGNPTGEELDEIVQLICDSYGNQFTIDEFHNGLEIDPDSEDSYFFKIGEFLQRVQGIKANAQPVKESENQKPATP